MFGWHFLSDDCRLGYGDGREVIVGETLTVDCEPVMCQSGLHWSENILDALYYAPGNVCSFVEGGGTIITGDDKCVGTSRRTLWMGNIERELHLFACDDVAEDALSLIENPDERSVNAITVKRLWVDGKATDEELAAARTAAWAAARTAAEAARWAPWDTAWAASRASRAAADDVAARAAWDASRAAWDASRAASRDAWAKYNQWLEDRAAAVMGSG